MRITFEVDTNDTTTTTKILYRIADLFEEIDKGKAAPVPTSMAAPSMATTSMENAVVTPVAQVPEVPFTPTVPPVPAAAPAPAPVAPSPAPVASAPALTVADLMRAAGELVVADPNVRPQIQAIIRATGAGSVSAIPADQIPTVAAQLQQLGAVFNR